MKRYFLCFHADFTIPCQEYKNFTNMNSSRPRSFDFHRFPSSRADAVKKIQLILETKKNTFDENLKFSPFFLLPTKNFKRSDVLVYVTLCTFMKKLFAGCMVHDAFFSLFPDDANAHFQFSLLIASCSRLLTCDCIIKERKRAAASDAY